MRPVTRSTASVPAPADAGDPAREALGGPALRAFFAIAAAWGLRPAEARRLLGDPPESTFYKWKKAQDGALGRDALERISHVLGIFKSLQILFPDPTRADVWLRRPNGAAPFGGGSALQRMLVKGWVLAEWKISANNRRARFYRLTTAGKKQLADEIQRRFFDWLDQPVQRVTGAEASPSISKVLERAAIAGTEEVVEKLVEITLAPVTDAKVQG